MLLKEPEFRHLDSGKFEITSPMKYQWGGFPRDARGDFIITIPIGFVTDFASIPPPFRNLININGRHVEPAILHDYLYAMGGVLDRWLTYTRKDADRLFRKFMKEAGVGIFKRSAMYRAVRMFGWLHFRDTS